MKLNMWLIADRLKKYNPKYDIREGNACIQGVRFFSGEEQLRFEPQYIYMCTDTEEELNSYESTTLVNGKDILLLESKNVNDIINDLLEVFDYYNIWENSIWRAASHHSFQEILDVSQDILKNPVIIADVDGEVLAMSSEYLQEDINEYWTEIKETYKIPVSILGAPMQTEKGNMSSWTDQPKEYRIPNGNKISGSLITGENGEVVAAIAIWEYKTKLNPGYLWLIKILCDVLKAMLSMRETNLAVRSSSGILLDLLLGKKFDEELLHKLELPCKAPWQILVLDNSYRNDTVSRRGMIRRFQTCGISCIPFLYGESIIVLTTEGKIDLVLRNVLGTGEQQYYLVGSESVQFMNYQSRTQLRFEPSGLGRHDI